MEAFLLKLWSALVAIFMAPGEAMMRGLASTPWGQEFGAPAHPETVIVIGVSLLFWCILISLLNAMDDQVRGFLNRGKRRPQRRA